MPSKGADAAFAAGIAPNGVVQLAQLVIKLYQTVVVSDQRVLFRVGQEAQAADEGGLIVVVEVVVVRQIKVRFIYLVPQVGVLFAASWEATAGSTPSATKKRVSFLWRP